MALPVDSASAALTELVVTARKREESLQRAPVSVTALTSTSIREQSITNVRELAGQIPGLTFQESFGRRDDRPGIRGLTTIGTPGFGVESGAAVFVDGVYVNADTSALGLQDLDRIEVVRGPQSALYGRNTYSGALNFVTRGPGDELEGYVSARAAEHDEYEISAGISGPIVDGKLSGGLNVRHYEYGGEWKNAFNGNTVGDEQTQSVAGVFKFTPTETVTIQGRAAYAEDDDGHFPLDMAIANTDFSGNGFIPNTGDDYFVGELPSPTGGTVGTINEDLLVTSGMERETLILTLRADIDLPNDYSLTISGGYHDQERRTGSDSAPDATSLDAAQNIIDVTDSTTNLIADETLDQTDWSIEARLSSPQEQSVRWTLGAFYFEDERTDDNFRYLDSITGDPADSGTLVPANRGGAPNIRETENWAVFGSLAWDVTENLTGTVELRYAEDKKSIGPIFELEETFTSTNPRYILEYQATEDALIYASIARGNKPGGFNDASNRDPLPPLVIFGGVQSPVFDEETSWNYEIGAKTSWFDNKLQLNGSLYYSEVEDAQLTQVFAWLDSDAEFRANSQIVNLEELEVLGGEIELRAAPTENLDISLGYAYTDSEIQVGSVRDQGRLTPPDFASTGPSTSVAGKKMPRISEHQVNGSITYTHPLANGGDLYANLNGVYESERFVQVHNLAIIPESTILNARVGFRMNGFDVALFGKNLTDEDSIQDALRFRNGNSQRAFQLTARRGQQFGIELRKDF